VIIASPPVAVGKLACRQHSRRTSASASAERRALLVIPRGLPRRAAWLGHPLVGEEGNQRGQPQQRRGGAADRRRGPLALRLDTAVAARLLERDRQLPALHEPPEDPRGRGGLVGAAQRLGGERALRVADEDPAQRHRGPAGVVPHGGVRDDFNLARARAVPVGDGHPGPDGRRVGGDRGEGRETRAREPGAAVLARAAGWRGIVACGVEAQTGDDRDRSSPGGARGEEGQRGVAAVGDGDDGAVRLPAPDDTGLGLSRFRGQAKWSVSE